MSNGMHKCPGCSRRIRNKLAACGECWKALPLPEQSALMRTAGTHGAERLAAIKSAADWYRARENNRQSAGWIDDADALELGLPTAEAWAGFTTERDGVTYTALPFYAAREATRALGLRWYRGEVPTHAQL